VLAKKFWDVCSAFVAGGSDEMNRKTFSTVFANFFIKIAIKTF
jgi:hypothetical protein